MCSTGPSAKTIGRIDSIRVVSGQESCLERRYYISSRDLRAVELASAVRAHRGVENRLHLVLDVSFCEDGKTKASLRLQCKGAAGDDDLRKNMLGPIPFMMFECRSPG